MKKIVSILVLLMICFTLSSCVATVQAQVDDMYDDVDVSLVVTYGTPHYNAEGLLLYYIYNNMYYYPYYYHNRYYLHRYHRPFPPNRMRVYRPLPRDFHSNRQPHRYHVTPPNRSVGHMTPNRHSTTPRANGGNRPNVGNNRPNVPNRGGTARPSTPRSHNGGGFGHGRR